MSKDISAYHQLSIFNRQNLVRINKFEFKISQSEFIGVDRLKNVQQMENQ